MSNFSEDDIRHAAEVREWIMKQISDKQEQVDRLSTILALIDNLLKQSSFKPASSITSPSSSSSSPSSVGSISQRSQKSTISTQELSDHLRSQSIGTARNNSPAAITETTASPEGQNLPRSDPGKVEGHDRQVKQLKRLKDNFLIANAEILQNSVELIPAKGIVLNINTPPFRSFFLNRILEGMKTKDAEKVSQNQIDESTSLNYYVEEDENGIIKRILINNYRDNERLNEIFNTSTWVFTRMIEKTNRA